MATPKKAPIGFTTVEKYAEERSQSVEMVIERLESGIYKGRKVGEIWFIKDGELSIDSSSSSSANTSDSKKKLLLIFGILLIGFGIALFAGKEFFANLFYGPGKIHYFNGVTIDEGKNHITKMVVYGGISFVIGVIMTITGFLKK